MNRSRSPRLRTPVLALAAALVALPFAPLSIFAAPKVESTVAGPLGEVGHYVISERGAHIAWAGAKANGKSSVIVDGIEGPEFDALLRPTGEPVVDTKKTIIGPAYQSTTGQWNEGPVLMSVDGEHHAYLARQGADIVVIHDGKEVGRAPADRYYFQSNPLRITPNGRQVCWTEVDPSQTELRTRVVVTGKPGPWTAGVGSSSVVFSADESRHAYRYTTTDKKHALAVDGKDAGYLGNNPTFTADGKLLITSTMEGKDAVILVNGKAVAKGARAGRIVAASSGGRWAALLYRKDAQYNDVSVLIVDGKEVPDGAETVNIWFSPDGKRYAAASHHHFNRGPDYMVVDGKRGTEFPNVTHETAPFWSPDSSTLIYTAKSATGPEIVAVAGGQETVIPGRLQDESLTFSARGGHYALSTVDPRQQNRVAHIVDGKEVATGPSVKSGSFVFSADGARHGYLLNQQGTTASLALDGTVVPDFTSGFLGTWSGGTRGPWFSLSPNGKSVAAYARDAANTVVGLWLDGKVVHPTKGTIMYPTFTPDGKHLAWAADGPTGTVVYVDGVPALQNQATFLGPRPDRWSMDQDGVITFLGAEGEVAKRYRITPAADTSLTTLLANGTQTPAAPTPAATLAAAPPPAPPPALRHAAATTPAPAAAAVRATPAASPGTPTPPPAPLTWNDLVRRREARPATCTVNKDFRFQSGAVVKAGTLVNVIEASGSQLTLGTLDGQINFGARPEETDILAVANAAWAQLTPAQRDLTYQALNQRMDLWPYHIKLLAAYTFQSGQTKSGDSALFLGFEGSQPLVMHEATKTLFNVETVETDIMAQARATLVSEAGTPGRLMEELAGKLVSPLTNESVALDLNSRPKYVVMYRGAGWCGPCQVFSPQLVTLLDDKAPAASDVALIYISSDRTPAEAKAYVTKIGIDWPTLYYSRNDQLPAFNKFFGDSIPQLVVADRHGKVLIDSARVGQAQALQQLRKLL
ncbi:MAG: PD40 domain-containing protein [Opitutaceae bacterium]|nr:PD40 domain-containing protein [Opitutaceae bacterium]